MFEHHVVNVVNAALDIHKAAAPADEHIHVLKGDPVLLQELQDHIPAVRELGGHVGIPGKLRRVMGDILGEETSFILKQRDFRGSGTGINRKNANSHSCSPPIFYFMLAARTAEMMMLPLISLTGAPREQSHTTLLKPCSMGP